MVIDEFTLTIKQMERDGKPLYTVTSPDCKGLFLAHQSLERCLASVPWAFYKLRELNDVST
jgi:hypothetical protein